MWLATCSSRTGVPVGVEEERDEGWWGGVEMAEEGGEGGFGGEKSFEMLGYLARICRTDGRGKTLRKA